LPFKFSANARRVLQIGPKECSNSTFFGSAAATLFASDVIAQFLIVHAFQFIRRADLFALDDLVIGTSTMDRRNALAGRRGSLATNHGSRVACSAT
jgi:hypothetical protein